MNPPNTTVHTCVHMSKPPYCHPMHPIPYFRSISSPRLLLLLQTARDPHLLRLGPSSPVAAAVTSGAAAAAAGKTRLHADGGRVGDAREVRTRDGEDGPCMAYRLSRVCCVDARNAAAAACLSSCSELSGGKRHARAPH
jgi:hypothetical protein